VVPIGMFGRTKSANNAANKKNSKKSDLDLRLELVEGGGDALMHTPSVAADLATGMAQGDAARAQRLREQLRIIDAELAETKAKLIRFRLMRGPSGKRFVCDDDCIVGGCGEEFAEEDGILCSSGCQLFLCHKCFGATVVMNECQQGGRYDAPIESGAGGGMMSAQGSLPCPNYPQSCSCAHIPIAEIQRALLHTSNRGEDGPFEDLESPGLSPHKVFLMARRRQAETKLSGGAGDGASPRLRESTLVRTVTEARQFSSALEGVVGLSYTTSNFRSGARAALADKVDELEQLRYELEQLPDSATSIPAGQLRRCVQCCGEFTMFEGAQCVAMRHNHFLCNVCFGEYLMKACARGGVFEQALTNSDGMVVSPAGKLPCPFFSGNPRQQLAINPVSSQAAAAAAAEARAAAAAEVTSVENPLATGKLPELDCHCGVVELGSIERVLMDPRNTSASFWRERKANESIETQAASSGVSVNDQAASGPWSWGVELLARGWTPSSVHETARLRVNVEAEQQEEQRRAGLLSPKEPGEVDALADLYLAVANALTHGASIQCPGCGVQAMKDDACIHMDSCPCRTHWCFLCRRISGDEPGQCPRGPDAGGCDGISYYLERHDGWGDFAIAKNGETPGAGAREEFLRRRQAYYVRQVMEATDPELWRLLQSKSPKLLDDVPTPGRRIPWDRDELSSAEFPLFGSNVGQEDISELVSTDTAVDTVAAANFQQHYRDEMDAEQRREQAARRRRRVKTMQALGAAATIALLTAWVNLTDFENPLSFVDPPIAPGLWSLQNDTAAVSADSLSPSVEAHCTRNIAATMAVPCQCGWPCDLMFWVPALELLAGFLLVSLAICLDLHDFRGDAPLILCLLSVAVCVTGWPLFTGPLSHWFVAYILNPVFLSMGASMFAMLSVLCIIDADDDLDDSCVESMLCCAGFVGFFGYVGLTYHARDLYEGAPVSWNLEEEASSDDDDLVELALYQCTAACVALRWTVGAVGVAGCFSLPIVIVADWDENWKPSSTMGVIKIPLFLLLFVVVGFWPLAIEADVWMASVWLYFALCVSQMFTWLASCRALEIMLRGCDWWDAFEDYRLAVPFAFLPLLLECGMLYLFRSSVPDYEGESSSFATLVHVQISFWLFFALFLEVTVFEDEDGPGAWMVFVAICVYACNADAMQRAWFCVLFMFVFSSWTGLLGIVAHELAGEDAAPRWWRRLFGRCAPCLFCVWLIIQNGLMGWTYMRSAPDDMPTVYSIQGASNAQLNGQYHLRVDLLDGVAAETECPHAWYTSHYILPPACPPARLPACLPTAFDHTHCPISFEPVSSPPSIVASAR
jgi:hypothetical protein